MVSMREFLKLHRPAVVLMGIVLVLTAIPALDTYLVLGNSWKGIVPSFTDEGFYYARIQTIAEGYLTGGEPYFFEHRYDPPLVIFGGVWVNALPLLAGLPFTATLMLNFILWSLLFAASLYYLFRELRVSPWVAVFGTLFIYIQSYAHVWRPVNLQPVYPFYFLFYIALARLIREQSRRNIIVLAAAIGASFYFFSYLWQTIVITLGLLFFYAFIRKNWPLLKAVLLSSLIGGAIGLPVPLYAFWLSHASPYFWESVYRLGLVDTHLPMAEIIYSGGWVGIVLALLALLYWRMRALRENREFLFLTLFLFISGLGLWVMQGSNGITGKLLSTGEHVKLLILPWLVFSTISVGVSLYKNRTHMSKGLQAFSVAVLVLLMGANVYFTNQMFPPILPGSIDRGRWQTEQSYAKPLAWLQDTEKEPVVVWSDPHDPLVSYVPIYTKHFTLYATNGMYELMSEGEVHERYLVSQYFNNPTVADLKNDMPAYLGMQDTAFKPKTIERGIKICRILFFWDKNKNCGTPPTPIGLLGEKFFSDLEQKFQTDIKPNIKAYLKKYHVSYILKDNVLDPQYHPEKLGATRVYSDERFEIYRLP